ncbi:hypothetical protein LQV05_002206 [Cryptococcus neoformans]|nr:hypothetical protein C356_06487 [Cryptococcus neoformans var. grubii c45]OXB33907.1 hypothetical protein J007_06409 [Cryptococcus neoformans var. grubii]OXC58052.1 hypothetical protein C358_06503 [Cryptococcus neoformans var. grubii MW-RSA852]UOH85384.1 hypothetical protein LQV05_002206 [Cryptococcus neoformans]
MSANGNSITTRKLSISRPAGSFFPPTAGSTHKGLGESFLHVEEEDHKQDIDSVGELGSSWGSDFLEGVRSQAQRSVEQDNNTRAARQTDSSETTTPESTAATDFSRRLGSTLNPAAESWYPAQDTGKAPRNGISGVTQTCSQPSTQNGQK